MLTIPVVAGDVAYLVKFLSCNHEALDGILTPRQLDVVAHASDVSTQKVNAGGSEVQGHPQQLRVSGQPRLKPCLLKSHVRFALCIVDFVSLGPGKLSSNHVLYRSPWNLRP